MSEKVYLTCPECGEDAIPASSYGCLTCGDDEEDHGSDCHGFVQPMWCEDDGGTCPECGVNLRVSVDDGRAWASVVGE